MPYLFLKTSNTRFKVFQLLASNEAVANERKFFFYFLIVRLDIPNTEPQVDNLFFGSCNHLVDSFNPVPRNVQILPNALKLERKSSIQSVVGINFNYEIGIIHSHKQHDAPKKTSGLFFLFPLMCFWRKSKVRVRVRLEQTGNTQKKL
ncbi:MAG: hypothetical protein A2942_03750 [Candidatus Lloydbacteria bacterium RIFCSPLOWO2_01_FULL_50_20]|uniref:Uncharacterized protein n=1 Tax=Candidatus Lloydbacteria bacterium RIFCSPLOWO2_01_FULL_50_20 TaxID=1798665 RepID=A0A1G2DE24_9BACT|nr:MAG: hypothetical protein A2942_03750 [Candidatus Lloydbacteria bacterium RIFCSPLOWO2_01_FULL_50_20]